MCIVNLYSYCLAYSLHRVPRYCTTVGWMNKWINQWLWGFCVKREHLKCFDVYSCLKVGKTHYWALDFSNGNDTFLNHEYTCSASSHRQMPNSASWRSTIMIRRVFLFLYCIVEFYSFSSYTHAPHPSDARYVTIVELNS